MRKGCTQTFYQWLRIISTVQFPSIFVCRQFRLMIFKQQDENGLKWHSKLPWKKTKDRIKLIWNHRRIIDEQNRSIRFITIFCMLFHWWGLYSFFTIIVIKYPRDIKREIYINTNYRINMQRVRFVTTGFFSKGMRTKFPIKSRMKQK